MLDAAVPPALIVPAAGLTLSGVGKTFQMGFVLFPCVWEAITLRILFARGVPLLIIIKQRVLALCR